MFEVEDVDDEDGEEGEDHDGVEIADVEGGAETAHEGVAATQGGYHQDAELSRRLQAGDEDRAQAQTEF